MTSRIVRIVAAAALLALSSGASAQVKIPTTAADHLALAKSYQDKAGAWKKEAQYHRDMLEEYKRSALPPDKSGKPNPWVQKMTEHCKMIYEDADKLAADATKMAEYHTLRAKELQGK